MKACAAHQKHFPGGDIHRKRYGDWDKSETTECRQGQLLPESETEFGRMEMRDSIRPCRYEHKPDRPGASRVDRSEYFERHLHLTAEARLRDGARVPTWRVAVR